LLHDLGRDDLFLVNPKGGAVSFGGAAYFLYRSLPELPATVEMVVYAAPAQSAPEFLRTLGGSSVKAVILIPGIPATMPYGDFAHLLREAVPPGLRVIGPNCMGVYFAPARSGEPISKGLNTLFINERRLEVRSSERSNAVLLTQSGALAVTALDKLHGCRPFRAVVSFGNKFDVNVSDLLAYFEGDPSVNLICMYLEGFDPGRAAGSSTWPRAWRRPSWCTRQAEPRRGRGRQRLIPPPFGSYAVFRAACQQAGSSSPRPSRTTTTS
jgi:acyl-CoA synthetase (NDP forming)